MRGRVALCAAALLAALASSARAHLAGGDGDQSAPGTAHMSPMPFLMNVRYGRSPPDRRHMEPRADRFFMGSRYGKRSHPVEMEMEEVEGEGEEQDEREAALVCRYTGVLGLYQCHRTRDRDRGRDHEDWDHEDWDQSGEKDPSESLRGRR